MHRTSLHRQRRSPTSQRPRSPAGELAVALSCGWLVLAAGCAAPAEGIRVSSPFTPRDAELFDDAADFLKDATGLDGAWAEGWKNDLHGRSKGADVVAVVKINTIISDVDLQQRQGVRLMPSAVRALRGTLPPETGLRVSQGRPGFVSVDHNRTQLMDGTMVLFVKWYEAEDKSIAAHWHLSPASEQVMSEVEEALGMKEKGSSHIVIHRE